MTQSNFNFNNVNMSGSNNAIGSSDFTQEIGQIQAGNLGALEATLREHGIDDDQLAELLEAIQHDKAAGTTGSLGERVRNWLSTILKDAATASASIITTAVMAYLGLPAGA
jgi:uncharacterized membrane protein